MINFGFLSKDFVQLPRANDIGFRKSKLYFYSVQQENLQDTLKDQLPFTKTLPGYIYTFNIVVFPEKLLLAY